MSHQVLIVDDSATMRAVIKKALALSSFKVGCTYEAGNGREALKLLGVRTIDLVLADLNMPEMGGEELIEAMQQDPRLAEIPVIVISTEGSRTRLTRLAEREIVGFLRKPFTAEQFHDTIAEALSTS
jgi:two-component system chemotaxis response regulator CheY